MKKIITLVIVLSAFSGNAQRTMFHAQNKYVAQQISDLAGNLTQSVQVFRT